MPAPRFHEVRYFGVLPSASKVRPLIVPRPAPSAATDADAAPCTLSLPPPSATASGSRYRSGAELLKRTFAVDVETCPHCGGRMRLLALITESPS